MDFAAYSMIIIIITICELSTHIFPSYRELSSTSTPTPRSIHQSTGARYLTISTQFDNSSALTICRCSAGTSSRMRTVRKTTGLATTPPGLSTRTWTECWSPHCAAQRSSSLLTGVEHLLQRRRWWLLDKHCLFFNITMGLLALLNLRW